MDKGVTVYGNFERAGKDQVDNTDYNCQLIMH